MRERVVESAVVEAAKRRGGMAVKFVSPGCAGVSDRLVLLPVAPEHREIVQRYVKLIETKAPGGKLRPLQRWWMEQVQGMGHCATWVARREDVEGLFK